jgi:hypothetical protein
MVKKKKKIQKKEKESLLWRAEANIGFMWLVPWIVFFLILIMMAKMVD